MIVCPEEYARRGLALDVLPVRLLHMEISPRESCAGAVSFDMGSGLTAR